MSNNSGNLYELYDVEDGELKRKNKFSPKAKGVFMAEHEDRRTCGKTSYMEKK